MRYPFSTRVQAVILLFVVLIAGCENPDPASSYPEPFYGQLLVGDSLLAPVPQQKTTRDFEPVATIEIRQFTVVPALATEDTPAELVMAKPNRATVNRAGDVLFLMDIESFLINKYNLRDGSLLNVITTAKEKRTATNYGPSIGLISENEIGVGGVVSSKVLHIDVEGKNLGFIDYISGESFVSASGKQIWLKSSNAYELFHVYNDKGEKEEAFGVLSSLRPELGQQKLKGHGLGFAGSMATDGTDSFIYTSLFGSALLGFETDGALRFFRDLVDPVPFPEMNVSEEVSQNSYSVDQSTVVSNRFSINVWENVYYQIVFFTESGQEPVIDAYSYSTGEYLYSLKNPANCTTLFISTDYIYANCPDRGFIQFERPANSDSQLALM